MTDVLVRGYDARGAVSEDSVSVDGQLCSSEKGLEGCSLEIYGNNFGSRPSFTKINIGGKECLEARWYPSNEVGLPYLKCKPQLDVVGVKNATVTIAGQTVLVKPRKGSRGPSSMFNALCRRGTEAKGIVDYYYGREGEFCVPCPRGAFCSVPFGQARRFTYKDPKALERYFRVKLDLRDTEVEAKEAEKRVHELRLKPNRNFLI